MLNEEFIEALKECRMATEIPSPKPTHRRWVEIFVYRDSIITGHTSPALGRFATGPFYWKIRVFDFDHITYNLDETEDYDLGTDKREHILEMVTIDLDKFEKELRYWVHDLDSFYLRHNDFPD